MTPNKNDCIPEQFIFEQVKSCPVVVNFNSEPVTSDAGLTLIAELDRKREITSRLAACFKDYREPNKILHPVNGLIAQRIYGLIMGYEDVNDHETLRHDGIFALAVGKAINLEQEPITLAGKSTLNRIEHCPEDISSRADSRYHRIEHDASAIETLLVELFLESYRKPPRQITLDLDVTDDPVHGNQEKTFFNPYYRGYCYAPLYIFCGKHLLAAKLRASNVDPAEGGLGELQRVIKIIRSRWKEVKIIIRGDSAYSREDIMSWCESQTEIYYVLGLAQNNRLLQLSQSIQYRASQEYSGKIKHIVEFFETLFPPSPDLKNDAAIFVDNSVWYCSLDYQTLDSWSRHRRVVAKVEYSHKEVDTRFVVTSLPVNKIPPGRLYTQKYCPRGNMENCLKEQKLGLHSDRTSTHTFEGNQLRLWFASIAYIEVIHDLQDLLTFTGLQAEVIFSNGRDVDIIPKNSNKGKATAYLQELLQAQSDATVICGGSGNDISLFQQPSGGIIVANAQTELLWWYYKTHYPWHFLAHYPGAAGILEGLIYFNILPFPNSWKAMGYEPP